MSERNRTVLEKHVLRWLLAPLLLACGGNEGEVGTDGNSSGTETTAGPGETDASTGSDTDGTSDGSTETTASSDSNTEMTSDTTTTDSETDSETGINEDDLYDALADIEGMTVEELDSPYPQYRMFLLTYQQPQDHNNLDGVWFPQRMVLSHLALDQPMVLATSGYGLLGPGYLSEPTVLLESNQLAVEQRFFSASKPEPADWQFLTIEQAATDHHRIVEALAPIYGGVSWVSTGASKGGMTSVYHRRFFPDDVDATLAYVAPHNLAELDDRYGPYIDMIGTPACVQALKDMQATALSRRDTLVPMLEDYAQMSGNSFDHVGIDRSFEFMVIESRFVFWQYGGAQNCGSIPTPMASDAELFAFFDDTVGWSSFSDDSIAYYGPYYFQAAHQLGAPALPEDHLGDLRLFPGEDTAALYAPAGTDPVWDAEAMPDVSAWMDSQGERLMFIYGGRDPWSATAFDPGGAIDTHQFWVQTGNHGANLSKLPDNEFNDAFTILKNWMGVGDVVPEQLQARRSYVQPWPEFRHAGL